VADDSRIHELERRVDSDPASIAFAHLGEEYRRAGRFDDAIRVCRAGLARSPTYLSARVTLGRALLAQGLLEEARLEIEAAMSQEPGHVGASAALEDWRRGAPATEPGDDDRALQELERWLRAIRAERARRAASATSSQEPPAL